MHYDDVAYNIREKLLKRLINVGIIICLFGICEQILIQPHIIALFPMLILLSALVTGHIVSSKYNRTDIAEIIIGVVAIYVTFPTIYFTSGGIRGGAPIWFVLGLFYIIGIFNGKKMYVFLTCAIIEDIIIYVTGYIYPELIIPIESEGKIMIDSAFAIIFVGTFLGVITKFQLNAYNRSRKIAISQRDEIEKFSKSRNAFFASMSHEIRTPINTIIGLDEMILREKGLSDEVTENAETIQNAGKMLLSLVNDILDLSQIENNKMEIFPVKYSTEDMFNELIEVVRYRIEEKGLAFYVNIDSSMPSMLYGDAKRIKQVLLNILVNAAKYTKDGSVTLTAKSEAVSKDKCELTISVLDTGIGIKSENINTLFDSFSRGTGRDVNNIEGTGLGLSISKQLMELMGGEITVDSIYTKGSNFTVVLEQKIIDAKPIGNIDFLVRKGSRHLAYRRLFEAPDVRILLVDDNDTSRMVITKLLRETKVQIDQAKNALEALDLTHKKYYNIILMDYMMPGIDGREALQKIRRQENGLCKESAVLLMTAEGDSSIINKIMEEGFDGYIEKPVQGNGLEASIMSFIPNELLEFKAKTENVVVKTLAGETIIKPNVLKKKLIITTDCVCDISTGEAKQLGIMQVYLYVNTPSGRFKDTIEIGIDNVSSMLEKDRRNIHASAVSVEDYENFFASRLTEAEEVLHLSFGKNMGKSYWNAISAAKCFGSVHVLDSGLLSCGLSIVIKYASEALKNGASLEEITKLVQDMKGRVNTRFLLDSIDPFYENGYIGKKMRNIFNLFHLHPILAAKKSGLHIDGFMLGDIDSARIRFIKKTVKKIKNKTVNDIYVSHTGISVKQQEMAASVIEKAGICDNVVIHKSSVTNACFSGPGTIGIAYYKK